MNQNASWECVVVGAGAAGLSAALVLGRARRRTLVIDAGEQSNLPAHGIGGLLGSDRMPPADFYAAGRAQVGAYSTVEIRAGRVARGHRKPDGFQLDLADGTTVTGRRVLLATGMEYRFPQLEGIEERWGRSVVHCPFCHGWELRERPLGVLEGGGSGVHRAVLLRAWSDDVTLFTDGPATLELDDVERLRAAGIDVEERTIARLTGPDGTLDAVVLADGDERPCGGLLVPVTLHQRSDLAAQLGASRSAGPLAADAVDVDARLASSVPGLFAAGDASAQMPSVANAVAAGSTAAAMVVGSLMAGEGALSGAFATAEALR